MVDRPTAPYLEGLRGFEATRLRPTRTRVRRVDGSCVVEDLNRSKGRYEQQAPLEAVEQFTYDLSDDVVIEHEGAR
jgi:hypothetical protein